MKNLNSTQRSYLKSKAHHLEPVTYIGKNGLTKGAIHSISTSLSSRELIKIKLRDFKDDKENIAKEITRKTHCHLVGTIGHTIILFKQHTNPEKQKYLLP